MSFEGYAFSYYINFNVHIYFLALELNSIGNENQKTKHKSK